MQKNVQMDEHWGTVIVLVQKHGQAFEQLSSRLCVAASTRPRTRSSDVTMVWETTMFVVLLEAPSRPEENLTQKKCGGHERGKLT